MLLRTRAVPIQKDDGGIIYMQLISEPTPNGVDHPVRCDVILDGHKLGYINIEEMSACLKYVSKPIPKETA